MSEYGFEPFCKNNEDLLLTIFTNVSKNIPPKMNFLDYRYHISGFFCHALSKEFSLGGEGSTLKSSYAIGYDLLFSEKIRISVKISRKMFQNDVDSILSKLTKEEANILNIKKCTHPEPAKIILKNLFSYKQESNTDINFDFLLVIQRGDFKNKGVRFGIVSSGSIMQNKVDLKKSGDQIYISLFNHQYDFLSKEIKLSILDTKNRNSGLDMVFSSGLANTYDDLLKFK